MRRSEALQGVRVMRFLDILGRYEAAEFNQLEAAELLGVEERTFRRWRQRFEDDGEAGLLDRRLGKASGKRVPIDREHEVEALYRERYQGFTAKHFHEHLVAKHNFAWSYTWTKTFLQSKGLLEKAKRRGAHRRKRPRRPLPGMMLHQDGSRHVWVQGQPALDLIVTLDDATSAIYSAFLITETLRSGPTSQRPRRATSPTGGRGETSRRRRRSRSRRPFGRSSSKAESSTSGARSGTGRCS